MYDALRADLPQLFDPTRGRSDWQDEWLVIPVAKVESTRVTPLEEAIINSLISLANSVNAANRGGESRGEWPAAVEPPLPSVYRDEMPRPGAPVSGTLRWPIGSGDIGQGNHQGGRASRIVPDALAFYLPFHYFDGDSWGVYLRLDGVISIADYLLRAPEARISATSAWHVAKLFLYYHEAFHHGTECFVTRLEIDRRVPLYVAGVQQCYAAQMRSGPCLEESLAVAHSLRALRSAARRLHLPATEVEEALHHLAVWLRAIGAPYADGVERTADAEFRALRNTMSEEYRAAGLGLPRASATGIWQFAPHGYRGHADIAARTNYLVNPTSPWFRKSVPRLRFFSTRVLIKQFERLGAEKVREKGDHMIYRAPNGEQLQIPRHATIKRGIATSLLRTAGLLRMPLEEFLSRRDFPADLREESSRTPSRRRAVHRGSR